jgi:16S rRNA (adenine1518-N6/adenine1519-N6)-dimethyltransferase
VSELESPKQQLLALGLVPKRHFGQNFLADPALTARIAELAAANGESVVELGAGLGALTAPLLERAAHVVAVERDRDLLPALRTRFSEALSTGRLELLEADAKAIDPEALLRGRPRPHVLCGNLPYQLTGPLLQLSMRFAAALERVVFLVQLEVAARLSAAPGSADYGALSVFAQAAFDVRRAFVIRRGAFYPQPGVDSAVVVLTPREQRTPETEAFRALVRGAFAKRRKKLRNAWLGVLELDSAALEGAARAAGIDLDARGETLGVQDFWNMAERAEALRK